MFDPTAEWDESECLRVFNLELLPWLTSHGPEIGERAMQGDLEAENLIRRYGIFCEWKDPENLKLLRNQAKAYSRKLDN